MLHFKCFRIMDLGVVKMGCFLILIVVYGGKALLRFFSASFSSNF